MWVPISLNLLVGVSAHLYLFMYLNQLHGFPENVHGTTGEQMVWCSNTLKSLSACAYIQSSAFGERMGISQIQV